MITYIPIDVCETGDACQNLLAAVASAENRPGRLALGDLVLVEVLKSVVQVKIRLQVPWPWLWVVIHPLCLSSLPRCR